ncbi:MAG TPA: hypothetical protein VHM72_09335, partial [Solirubrobacteraceae bacterium]|nr:hypothetical protein [Solirubrobacteraceae bacterium]
MLTSLLASLIVLAVTLAIVGELIERRARRRWSVLGQYVLFAFVQTVRATWIGVVELSGLGSVDATSTEGLEGGARNALDTERLSRAVAAMIASPQRRGEMCELIVAIGAQSRSLITNWAPLMVDAGPYGPLFDRHVELHSLVSWVAETLEPGTPGEWLPSRHEILVRSSVATEYTAIRDDDWLVAQLVNAAQLAVELDFESTTLGFKLVSLASWTARLSRVNPLGVALAEPSTVAFPDEL